MRAYDNSHYRAFQAHHGTMVFAFDSSERSAAMGLSKSEVVASIGLPAIALGCRVGLSAALVRSLYHVARQSRRRPKFPRTTGQVAVISAGSLVLMPLTDHLTGARDVFDDFFRTHPDFRLSANGDKLTREQLDRYACADITTACHIIGMALGAVNVAKPFRLQRQWTSDSRRSLCG